MKNTFGIFAQDITQYMPPEFVKVAGRVKQIYVSDMVPTYCCEITPSYYLYPLRIETENRICDETMPELYEALSESEAYSEACYMHITDAMRLTHEVETYAASDEESLQEQFEEFREMHQGNHTFDSFLQECA